MADEFVSTAQFGEFVKRIDEKAWPDGKEGPCPEGYGQRALPM